MDTPDQDRASRVVDLSQVSLAELAGLDSPRLKKSLREVADQVERGTEVVAGFGSAI